MIYSKINNILGWLCGIAATFVYISTADPYNSWWDTGEFVASAYKMEIVHQPGAPLFLLIQNIFSNLAFGDVTKVAFWMNIGSAVCSGLTITFLFWTITALARKIVVPSRKTIPSTAQTLQISAAGLVGALAYAFTDTLVFGRRIRSIRDVFFMYSRCFLVDFKVGTQGRLT